MIRPIDHKNIDLDHYNTFMLQMGLGRIKNPHKAKTSYPVTDPTHDLLTNH